MIHDAVALFYISIVPLHEWKMIQRREKKRRRVRRRRRKKRRGEVDINWETNVKGSTLLCNSEREVTRRQKKPQHRRGWKGCVCAGVRVMGRNPFSRPWKATLLLPVLFLNGGFPFILCHASHVLLRRSSSVFMSVGVPCPEERGLARLCVFFSILSINNIGEMEKEMEVDVCFGTRRDVSLFAALSCLSILLLNILFPCDFKLSSALQGCTDLPGQISTYL